MSFQVIPSKKQFVAVIFDDICASIKKHIGECHEDVMVDGHHRGKERGESKLKFQVSGYSFLVYWFLLFNYFFSVVILCECA